MEALARCLECHYSATDPAAENALPLVGAVQQKLCLRFPPSANMMATQKGMIQVTMYPTINGQTFSCAEFEKEIH